MTRVLICTLGGQPKPVVHAIEQTPSDFVYFLCSTGDDPGASDVFVERGGLVGKPSRCPACGHVVGPQQVPSILTQTSLARGAFHIEGIQSPDDFRQVVAACKRIDQDISERFGEHVEVFANYTGGTKTMSLGLGVFALRQGRWILQFNATGERRTNTVRIEQGDFPIRQDTSTLRADDALKLAVTMEKTFNFEGAASVLSDVVSQHVLSPEDQGQVTEALRRCKILAARDRFDYGQAQAMAGDDRPLKTLLGRLRKTVEILNNPSQRWPGGSFTGLELVEDLRENAARCAARHRFDDAIGRLYRATELLAQIRLRSCHGVSTGNVDPSNPLLPASAQEWLGKRQSTTGPVQLGLIGGYELLALLDDELGHYFTEKRLQLLGLIEKRNHSYFAHGLRPIDAQQWHSIGKPWMEWLRGAQERIMRLDKPRTRSKP